MTAPVQDDRLALALLKLAIAVRTRKEPFETLVEEVARQARIEPQALAAAAQAAVEQAGGGDAVQLSRTRAPARRSRRG